MIWLSKLIILLVALLLPGICLAANAVPGYKSGHPVVYAITPLGGTPLGDPEAETGATAFEPQVLSSLSACEALSDNTPWVTAGTSVFCMPCDEAVKAWDSGASDTMTAMYSGWESPMSSATCFPGIKPDSSAYPDYSSGVSDPDAYILSVIDADGIATSSNPYMSLYIEGIQVVVAGSTNVRGFEFLGRLNQLELCNSWIELTGIVGDAILVNPTPAGSSGNSMFRLWNVVVSAKAAETCQWTTAMPSEVYHFLGTGGANGINVVNQPDITVKNIVLFNNAGADFLNPAATVIDFCATDDNAGTNSQNLNENAGGEWVAAFEDWTVGDFRAKAGGLLENTGTGGISWTTLMGDTDPLSTDMAGNARDGATPEIGPFEITAAATSGKAQNTDGFLIKPNGYQKKFPEFRKIVR